MDHEKAIQIIVVLFILAGVAYGVWRWQGRDDAPVSYRTAAVERGDIAKRVSASGTINPLVNVQVGSQVSGIIQKIFVDFNAPIKEGQLLAQLEPALFETQVKQAEGEYLSAKANVAVAKVVLDRLDDLFTKKIGPKSDRDDAQAKYDSALGFMQKVEGALQSAKADLDHTRIYSPLEGTAISRNVDVGQTVAASMSAPTLFVIAKDLTKMQIDINVGEGDIGQVREDQKVKFTVDAYPDDTFRGKVIQVRNQPLNVDNVVSYDVIVEVDNSELRLKPGMTANASVTVAEAKEALQIANSALRFRPVDAEPEPRKSSKPKSKHKEKGGSQTTGNVWIVGTNNSPQKVSVELGLTDGEVSEIKSGLSEGQEVIVGYSDSAPKEKTARSPFGSPSVGRMRPF